MVESFRDNDILVKANETFVNFHKIASRSKVLPESTQVCMMFFLVVNSQLIQCGLNSHRKENDWCALEKQGL
jgi:hypothetical protein